TARGEGTTRITASIDGQTATATLTVTAPVQPTSGAAPEPGPSSVILFQDKFDRPTSSIASGYSTRGSFVSTDGHGGGSAVRFPYSASSTDNLIEKSFTETRDIYFRYWYRLSPGADPTCAGRNGAGFKWFMAWRANNAP